MMGVWFYVFLSIIYTLEFLKISLSIETAREANDIAIMNTNIKQQSYNRTFLVTGNLIIQNITGNYKIKKAEDCVKGLLLQIYYS